MDDIKENIPKVKITSTMYLTSLKKRVPKENKIAKAAVSINRRITIIGSQIR